MISNKDTTSYCLTVRTEKCNFAHYSNIFFNFPVLSTVSLQKCFDLIKSNCVTIVSLSLEFKKRKFEGLG